MPRDKMYASSDLRGAQIAQNITRNVLVLVSTSHYPHSAFSPLNAGQPRSCDNSRDLTLSKS